MRACSCANTFSNTGIPSCVLEIKDTKKLIMVPTYGSAGTRNKIAAADSLNTAWFQAKIDATDALDRWYPLPLMEYVENTKAETVYETPPSGTKYPVAEGLRSFKAAFMMSLVDVTFLDKLSALGCNEVSVFEIDS